MNGAKRLGAVVVAVALVWGGLWLRGRWHQNPSPTPGPGTQTSSGELICDSSLTATCAALRREYRNVTVETPGDTAARLAAADSPRVKMWVAAGPWANMVDSQRQASGKATVFRASTTLAISPIVVVARKDRLAVLSTACKGALTWKCAAADAGTPWTNLGGDPRWGTLTWGHDGVDTSAGVACVAAITTTYFGRTDVATNDFVDNDGYRTYLENFERSIPAGAVTTGTNLNEFLVKSGSRSAVCTTEAEATTKLRSSSQGSAVDVQYPQRMTALAVRATGTESTKGFDSAKIAAALRNDGFRPTGSTTKPVVRNEELPSPGALNQLRQLTKEVSS